MRRRRRCRACGARRARPRRRRSTRSSTSSSPEAGQQRAGRVERDDLAGVHDRDPVAEPLGLVEVVGREQDRHLVAIAEAARSRRAARGGCAGRDRPSARRGTAPGAARRARGRSRADGARRRCSLPTGRSSSSARPSVSASSPMRLAPRRGVDAPEAGMDVEVALRPVRARSTTGSWKTTLLTLRAASGSLRDVEAGQLAHCRRSGRSSS